MANTFTANQYAPSASAASLLERMRIVEERKRLLAEEAAIEKWGQSKLSPVMGEQETFPEGTYYATMDTSATPRFKDSPIREFGYGLLTNLGLTTEGGRNYTYEDMQREDPDFRSPEGLLGMLDPRMFVRGIGGVATRSLDPDDSPDKWDYLMSALDALGLGGPKALGMLVANLRNKVTGFYGPQANPAAAMSVNAARAPADVAKQIASPAASARAAQGLSSATYDVLKNNIKTYDDLGREWSTASKTRRAEIVSERREMARSIAGQLNQNVIHNSMMGKPQKALQTWYDKHFRNVMNFERQNASQIFDDVDAELIFDMSHAAWGGHKGLKEGMQGQGVVYSEKVGTKAAGNSQRDVFASRQHNTLRKLYKHHEEMNSPLRTKKDYINALDEWDSNWREMLNLSDDSIVDGTNGVLFQFSPAGKSDYLLGGFNAIMKFGDDGTAKFFGTDKQDIFGMGIPGHSDSIVGIGTTSRKLDWKRDKSGKVTEKTGVPKRYKKPPEARPPVEVKKVGSNKNAAPEYMSKEERKLINDLLALSTSLTPTHLARRATSMGVPGGLLITDTRD